MALKRRHESHELAANERVLQRNRESDTDVTQFLLDEIPTGDMRTLRNVDIAACEIQTGDMGTHPNRALVMKGTKEKKEFFFSSF